MSKAWPAVPIHIVAQPAERLETPVSGKTYRQIGVRLWGQGAYERESIDGSETKYKTFNLVKAGDIIVNKIWARNGSVSVVSNELEGCYCSGEFPIFEPILTKIEPKWFYWITKTHWFWDQCDTQSRGTSGKNRIRPEKFIQIKIPLPPLAEQRRIVAKIERLAGKIKETATYKEEIVKESSLMLHGIFNRLTKDSPMIEIEKIAPLIRRAINICIEEEYPELGIKSFGKGTFHKPALNYLSVGTKRLYRIEPGDLIFNNVFAWEGAIAVAQPHDIGKFGSHRFITCVAKKGISTANFICFYLLTPEGLKKIGEASPGGAGRNRTLGLEKLAKITIPLPDYKKQVYFDRLQSKVNNMLFTLNQTENKLRAMLPSILDRAFKGEL